MKFSILNLLMLAVIVALAVTVFVLQQRPIITVIRDHDGFVFYEFEDDLWQFDQQKDDPITLTPEQFPLVVNIAESLCEHLDKHAEEIGFADWRMMGATYEKLRGIDDYSHAYSVNLRGHEYPAHLGINGTESINCLFLEEGLILINSDYADTAVFACALEFPNVVDATPRQSNPRQYIGGGN